MDADGTNTREGVALAEPVRVRLVQLAAEVLGRLPADEVPPALRAVARFAPAKRSRLGAPVLSAALDADEAFRTQVADVVTATSPQLVESLRTGTSTAASDPIDTAVVAYLVRPDGWPELIADATSRWADEQAGRDAASGELARLRAELSELRTRLKAESARVRDEVGAVRDRAAEQSEQTRRTLRTRTGELRAAERSRDDAIAEVAAARHELSAAREAHESDVRRLRARIAELERAAETVRRDARNHRDADVARLRLLLDTMAEVAAGLRRELSLPAGTLRPADLVEAGVGDGDRSGVRDAAALDQLLELPQVHLIVDGYNVTKTGYGELTLSDQRTRLITALAALQARTGVELSIVFDGGVRPPSQPRAPRGVRVLFSAEDEIADDLIRRLVDAEPPGRPVIVVTSDRAVVADVHRAGAWTASSAVLLARLGG